MEFTYDGLVRHAFGFQNPNHAAALFCLLLPWTWTLVAGTRRLLVRVAGSAVTLALLVMLALTYSRTGMMVMLGEAVLFVWLCRRERRMSESISDAPIKKRSASWLGMGALVLAFAVAAVATGAAGRLTGWITNPDKAFTNRFSIWRGGLELFSTNPSGVGLGNSGLLYTAFLAPEDSGIVVRTLVNSFLTLLVEQGVVWSTILSTALLFAVCAGWRGCRGGMVRIAALTTLAGGVVSALLSTCFDLSTLMHGDALGLTRTQIALSWLLLTAFAAPAALLWILGWRGGLPGPGKTVAVSVAASLAVMVVLAGLGRVWADERVPEIVWSDGKAFARVRATQPTSGSAIVLYDDGADLPAMIYWTRQWMPEADVYLPLSTWHLRTDLPALSADRLVLRGKCGHFADQVKERPLTLISPPADLPRPTSMDQLFLRKYAERPPWPLADDDPLRIEYY